MSGTDFGFEYRIHTTQFACLPHTLARDISLSKVCVLSVPAPGALSRMVHGRLDSTTRLVHFRCAHRVTCIEEIIRNHPQWGPHLVSTRILAETGRAVTSSIHARSSAPAPPVHWRMAVTAVTFIFCHSYTSPRDPRSIPHPRESNDKGILHSVVWQWHDVNIIILTSNPGQQQWRTIA